jgi:hypothetical protein
MRSGVVATFLFVAACGGAAPGGGALDGAGGGGVAVRIPVRPGVNLELQIVTARGRVLAMGEDGEWTALGQGATMRGVRELQVQRQGAVVALGHGDAAGRLWLRAGSIVRLGQDADGVHVAMRAGSARVRRPGSALALHVDAAGGSVAIEGDYVLATRADGATELAPTGAVPAHAEWSLALDRPELGAGVGSLEAAVADGDRTEPLLLRRVTVDVRTAGDLALTEVEHVFWNAADQAREGTFRFPVPDGAMLTGMAMEIDGKLMEGEIVEREKAREVYEKIVDSMQDPALLEWEEGNWFKLRVFPIEPKADKRVIIRYASPLAKVAAGWEYGFALGTPPADLPIGELVVKVDGAVVTHEQKVAAGIDVVVPIAAAKVPAVMQEARADGLYTAVRIPLPDDVGVRGARGPRRIAVVFDTSRSSLEARPLAMQIARTVLGELGPRDRFVVFASDVEVQPHAADYVTATADHVDAALAFVAGIEPDGASDLGAALAAVAAGAPTDVIYIGDGIPTWGERDRDALGAKAAAIGAPVHAGLVGKGASSELWADVAGRTGGRAAVVRREVDADRFALAATHTAEVRRLAAARIEPTAGVVVYPATATTIFAGDELVAVVKTAPDQPMPASLVLVGMAGDEPVRREISLAQPVNTDRVAARWAAHHIAAIDAAGAPREDIVAASEEYGVLSRFTSLLVLENDEAYEQHRIERRKAAEQARLAAAPQITGGDLDTLGAREPSLSPDEIQPGDPEIKIPAPADARSVVVSFPFGETKLAVWDADAQAWMVRFLIDRDTPDGDYQVRITITHADGRIELMSLPYTVDTHAPAVQLVVSKVAAGYRIRARQIEGANGSRRKDADKVEVVLPDGTILELAQTGWGRFEVVWETAPLAAPVTLRVVVRDRALNQAIRDLTLGGR